MEHRKVATLTPVVMYKEDLQALEGLMNSLTNCSVKLYGAHQGQPLSEKSFHSVAELFAARNLPATLDELTLEAEEVDSEGKLVRRVRVFLCKRVSNMQIFDTTDGEWVRDVYAQLKAFFKQRRPWYWYFAQSVPPVLNLSLGLSLVMVALIIASKAYQAIYFPGILVASAAVYFGLGFSKVTFRYARICMFSKPEDKRPNFEAAQLGTHATVLAVCASSVAAMTAGAL